jgi:methylmalonyl-CoA/ethylmalonyl-CoA epimerase
VKVTRIDHIGIMVADLDAALRFYTETCGLTAGPIETREQPPIRRCCLRIGDTELELIEARDPQQTMMRLLPHQGPGLYHIGLRVADVDGAAAELGAQGVPLVDGLREGGDMRIQYLHPAAAQGTMIELVTRKKR